MATIDLTGNGGAGEVPYNGQGKVYVIKTTVDLTAGAITENDIYQVLAIPANTLVRSCAYRTDTAAVGTTLTIDVGVTGDDSLLANTDGKATAGTIVHTAIGVAEASVQGVLYTSDDTIDVTMDVATSITAGPKFTVWAECVDFN
jgi:hypothetical protein